MSAVSQVSSFRRVIDERFLSHRREALAYAGLTGGLLSIGLFAYRYYADHIWSWDLFAVGATIVGVKLSVMTWHLLTD